MSDCLREALQHILENRRIKTLFQPIVDAQTGQIFGYEALSRGPSDSPLHAPAKLFEMARNENRLPELELLCLEQAMLCFKQQGLRGKLFLNVSPQSLQQSKMARGRTSLSIPGKEVGYDNIVIELTEQFPSSDVRVLLEAVDYYQELGVNIALDDLGAGYSSLQLWSLVKPAYVKIDRHFVSDIDGDPTKKDFVRSFVEIARNTCSKVIAEGIETEAEFRCLQAIGVDYYQGFLIGKPMVNPISKVSMQWVSVPKPPVFKSTAVSLVVNRVCVGADTRVDVVTEQFLQNPSIASIAIVKHGRPVGMVHRVKLLNEMSKPFGRELHGRKPIFTLMESEVLIVEQSLRIDQVSRLVTSRARYSQEDDFILVHEGRFAGIGQVIDLLRQITELQITQARHANPLTLMPGIVPVNDCMAELLENGQNFVVMHFDIDHFKPFNDIYGYGKGDEVILCLGNLLKKYADSAFDTAGHIGGDDFIVLWRSMDWQERVLSLMEDFMQQTRRYYSEEHRSAGGFQATDRFGQKRFFPLVSLSVSALQPELTNICRFEDIAIHLSPLKQAAKQYPRSCLVINSADHVVFVDESRAKYLA